jgi:hypothetical protein
VWGRSRARRLCPFRTTTSWGLPIGPWLVGDGRAVGKANPPHRIPRTPTSERRSSCRHTVDELRRETCGQLVAVVFDSHPQLTRAELPRGTFRTKDQDLRRLILVVGQEATPAACVFVADSVAFGAGQVVGHIAQFCGVAVGPNWLFCEGSTSLSGRSWPLFFEIERPSGGMGVGVGEDLRFVGVRERLLPSGFLHGGLASGGDQAWISGVCAAPSAATNTVSGASRLAIGSTAVCAATRCACLRR